eukprot:TRINITY_DN19660_c0_g1_i1.p1 TRINITY_DN19660_c0_g1~~TRINITY_DN19660_c0_g1_i1.p1  ORF type:complete len:228 (+),score=47.03 TRINITY_DN19660_c0_g1_i1:634-1317(+)
MENLIQNSGATSLANVLTINSTLRYLVLSCNKIGNDGFKSLCTTLTKQSVHLTDIDVTENDDINDWSALYELLQYNTSLKKLEICVSNLGVLKMIFESVENNTSLVSLSLHGISRINTSDYTPDLLNLLSKNHTIQSISESLDFGDEVEELFEVNFKYANMNQLYAFWPESHNHIHKLTTLSIEEILLILNLLQVPKELQINITKFFLSIHSSCWLATTKRTFFKPR